MHDAYLDAEIDVEEPPVDLKSLNFWIKKIGVAKTNLAKDIYTMLKGFILEEQVPEWIRFPILGGILLLPFCLLMLFLICLPEVPELTEEELEALKCEDDKKVTKSRPDKDEWLN